MPYSITWTHLEPLPDPVHGKPCARSSHGLDLVGNKEMLFLYGGESSARTPVDLDTQGMWLLKLDNKEASSLRWTFVPPVTPAPSPRLAHGQAGSGDDVYIFGGRGPDNVTHYNDTWRFHVPSRTWTEIDVAKGTDGEPVAPTSRSYHRMVTVPTQDNDSPHFYMFGGCTNCGGRVADLHRFAPETKEWHALPTSDLSGRGGSNLLILDRGKKLAVTAGFAGHETADTQMIDLETEKWTAAPVTVEGLRPRSVCVAASWLDVAVIFGGEVDPSDRGHEGAGGFVNDVVVLDGQTGAIQQVVTAEAQGWPEARGWSEATNRTTAEGKRELFLFGGLSGNDANPRRLDDLWKMEIKHVP